jgi:predicted outer membrane repeat protein
LNQNSVSASGGGIFVAAYGGKTVLNLTNTTVSQNSAAQYGGAIYNDGTGFGNAALTLTNCTLNQNMATLIASGIYNDALNPSTSGVATLRLRNTILRSGDARENLVNDGGTITSDGHNLSSDAAGGPAGTAPGGFLNGAGDIRNTDPQLSSLASNGGPTQTVALLPGSPAQNAGDDIFAPKLDQRGYLRVGVSDIGAFELSGKPIRITSITRLANEHIMLQGAGVPSASHSIQMSPDLSFGSFTIIGHTTADGTGALQYDDAGSVGLTKRFYRLAFP